MLLHEIHHVVLGHLSDPRYRHPADPQMMTLATEISANEYIVEPLPGEPARWQRYEHLGIGPGQSTHERYELLCKARDEGRFRDDTGATTCLAHSPEPGEPDCVGAEQVEELIEEAPAALPHCWIAVRGLRKPVEALSIDAWTGATSLDWPRWLARVLPPKSNCVTDYRRPDLRHPQRIGIVPGRSLTRAHRSVLAVVSMDRDELNAIGRELERLSRHVAVTVLECDDSILSVYPFAGPLEEVSGRGNTDLRPPFAVELHRQRRVEALIYFTDGKGPYPDCAPVVSRISSEVLKPLSGSNS